MLTKWCCAVLQLLIASRRLQQWAALCFTGLFTIEAGALTPIQTNIYDEPVTIDVRGYGTIAAVTSDSTSIAFRRDLASGHAVSDNELDFSTDSFLGLQMDGHVGSNWEAMMQLRLRAKEKRQSVFDNVLRFALIKYRPGNNFAIRLGKMPVDSLMLSESRDVGYAHPWVRPMSVVYGNLMLDAFTGMDVSYTRPWRRGQIEFRFGGGDFDTDYRPVDELLINLESDFLWNASLAYLDHSSIFRVGAMGGKLDGYNAKYGAANVASRLVQELNKLPASLVMALGNYNELGSDIAQYTAGYSYDDKIWLVHLEYVHTDFIQRNSYRYNAGYLSVAYRVSRIMPYVVMSRIYGKGYDQVRRDALALEKPVASRMSDLLNMMQGRADQSTFTAGLRWDFRSDMALKFQWDYNRVNRYGGYSWLPQRDTLHQDDNNNVFSVSLDFMF